MTPEVIHIVSELSRPEAYAHEVSEVGFLQTHISYLFFAGERVYKVKKPLDLGFLDYSTLERRKHFCAEEVRLNRRLAPGVYLGVVPIVERSGRLVVGGEGPPVEWAVEMVRLPEHRMLGALLDRGEMDNQILNDVAALLADFHAAAATGPGVDEHGTPAAITTNVEENFEQLQPFVDYPDQGAVSGTATISSRQFAFLRTRGRGFLASERKRLEGRVTAGRIREGHGDLHAGNLCLTTDGIVAYDCIEFSRRLSCGDVACDLAFLAMDLDYRGYPSFARYLVRRYAELTGDPDLDELIRFYKGYRATVRGKVAALATRQESLAADEREDLRRESLRYLQLAVSDELPPALILMCGLPASGKSWMAERLAAPLRGVILHSDVRRKTLAGMAPTERAEGEYGTGLYAPEMKWKTYRSLLEDAVDTLESGHSVIVDATFSRAEYRSPFVDAATRLELPYYVVHVSAADATIRERLAARALDPGALSDADLAVYERARDEFEPPLETPGGHVVALSSEEVVPEEASSDLLDRRIATETD